jgi:hypothetical protein
MQKQAGGREAGTWPRIPGDPDSVAGDPDSGHGTCPPGPRDLIPGDPAPDRDLGVSPRAGTWPLAGRPRAGPWPGSGGPRGGIGGHAPHSKNFEVPLRANYYF